MLKSMCERAQLYDLPEMCSPVVMRELGFKTLLYGNEVVCVGYYPSDDGKCFYAATYEFVDKQHKWDGGVCKLKWVASERFEDEGHAFKNECEHKGY